MCVQLQESDFTNKKSQKSHTKFYGVIKALGKQIYILSTYIFQI